MRLVQGLGLILTMIAALDAQAHDSFRIASYNVSLYFSEEGELAATLKGGNHARAKKLAAIIQHVRPDVVLLNEFDYTEDGAGASIFVDDYLGCAQSEQQAVSYPYRFFEPVNTGVSSGVDLTGDGRIELPTDAHGFGRYPGQYGMLVLSRYPIDHAGVRTFQHFLWRDMPDALWPRDPDSGEHYYSQAAREVLRLSSKSHWDLPVTLAGDVLHLLAAHPTPPVFDGPENRNGRRNHDEIRFWIDYIDGADYMIDDQGRRGGLASDARFVIAGDHNADPDDGDSMNSAISRLIKHSRVDGSDPPSSVGGEQAASAAADVNLRQRGNPRHDTAQFSAEGPGNLRLDYVLPSVGLTRLGGGIFWPLADEPGHAWIDASDHRLVWIDISL